MHYEFGTCSINFYEDNKEIILNVLDELKQVFKDICSKLLCTVGLIFCAKYNTDDIYDIQESLNKTIEYMVNRIPKIIFTLQMEFNNLQCLIRKFFVQIPQCTLITDEIEQPSSSSDSNLRRDPLEINILRTQYEKKDKFHKLTFKTNGIQVHEKLPENTSTTSLPAHSTEDLEAAVGTATTCGNAPTTSDNKIPSKKSSVEPLYSAYNTLPKSRTCKCNGCDLTEVTQFNMLYETLRKWQDLLNNDKPIQIKNMDEPQESSVDLETLIENYYYHIQEEESAIPEEVERYCLIYETRHIINTYLIPFLTSLQNTYQKAHFLYNNVQHLENFEILSSHVTELEAKFDTSQNELTGFVKVFRNHIKKMNTNNMSKDNK